MPITLLQLVPYAEGGMVQHLSDLLAHLDRSRFLPLLAAPPRVLEDRRLGQCDALFIPFPLERSFSPLRLVQAAARLRDVVRKHRVALVHAHGFTAMVTAGFASRVCRLPPFIVTHHGPLLFDDTPLSRRIACLLLARLLWSRAGMTITVSDALQRECQTLGRLSSHQMATVYNGIDLERCVGVERGASLDSGAEFLIVVVARLATQKGIAHFLDAAAVAGRTLAWLRFVIVGDGPLRLALTERVRRLGLESRVTFMGYRADALSIIAGCDAMVLPSLAEGLPLTMLEAMALGKPVIATRVGGIPEVVRHHETGLLVPPADPGALADAMIEMASQRDAAREMGERGRRLIEGRFTIDEMVRQTESIYDRILCHDVSAS